MNIFNNKYQKEKEELMKTLEESNNKDRRESMKKIDELDYNYKKQKQELDEEKTRIK